MEVTKLLRLLSLGGAVFALVRGPATVDALTPAQCDGAEVTSTMSPACYGLEPTFTSKKLIKARAGSGAYKVWGAEWQKQVVKACETHGEALSVTCTIEEVTDRQFACAQPPEKGSRVLVTVNTSVRTDLPPKQEVDGGGSKEPPQRDLSWTSDWSYFRVCVFPQQGWKGWTVPWFYELHEDDGVIELSTRPANLRWLELLARDAPRPRPPDDGKDEDTYEGSSSEDEEEEQCPLSQRLDRGVLARLLFGPATASGLAADLLYGGGHVHVDVDSGFDDHVHLLNFMTKVHNLRMLPLNGNVLNDMGWGSPPLSILGKDVRDRYRAFLHRATTSPPSDLHKMLADLREQVYVRTYAWQRHPTSSESFKFEQSGNGDMFRKFQHIRIDLFHRTIELRNLAAPSDAAGIIHIVGLIDGAIERTGRVKIEDLLDDAVLAFADTDEDEARSWVTHDQVRSTGNTVEERRDYVASLKGASLTYEQKRFAKDRAPLTKEEWDDVAARFYEFSGNNGALLCKLKHYMPTGLVTALKKRGIK